MAKPDPFTRKLALLGAQARIKELQAEAEAIYKLYPELRSRVAETESRPTGSAKRQFSVEGKKAISEGMRKYWARRKAKSARSERTSA